MIVERNKFEFGLHVILLKKKVILMCIAAVQGGVRQLFRRGGMGADRVLRHGEAFRAPGEAAVCVPCCE